MKLIFLMCSFLLLSACPSLQTRSSAQGGTRPESANLVAEARAEQVARLQQAEEDLRQIVGRVETLEQKESLKSQDPQQDRLQRIEDRLNRIDESLLLLDQKIAAISKGKPASSVASKAKGGPFERAESYFKNKSWKEAILEYSNYRDKYPKGRRYADATYKIGVCFQELSQNKDAKAFYQEVVSNFPKSKAAKSAKSRLKRLK